MPNMHTYISGFQLFCIHAAPFDFEILYTAPIRNFKINKYILFDLTLLNDEICRFADLSHAHTRAQHVWDARTYTAVKKRKEKL